MLNFIIDYFGIILPTLLILRKIEQIFWMRYYLKKEYDCDREADRVFHELLDAYAKKASTDTIKILEERFLTLQGEAQRLGQFNSALGY